MAKRRGVKLLLPRVNYDKLIAQGVVSQFEKETMLIPIDDILDVLQYGLEGKS